MAKSFREHVGLSPSTASVNDSTLIIIDAQNEYITGLLKTEEVDKTGAAIKSLLEKYRAAGRTQNIVHILHRTPEGAPLFTPGTELAEEFKELTPKDGEKVFWKDFPNSFAGTGLHEYLQTLGDKGKKIVLTGYMAHVCVSTTARAGHEQGYDVIVARDAVGDRHIPGLTAEQVKHAVLAELADTFGTVVEGSDIN